MFDGNPHFFDKNTAVLIGEKHLLMVKQQFLIGKQHFLVVKQQFSDGQTAILDILDVENTFSDGKKQQF